EGAIRQVWRPLDSSGGLREVVRAGTLGANSHNTQPWRITVSDKQITIRPDFSRRCPAVDPDDHHLFASLGCAAENMVQAASLFGLKAEVRFEAADGDRIAIAIHRTQSSSSELASAITERQCTRADYDGRGVDAAELSKIHAAATLDDVQCLL